MNTGHMKISATEFKAKCLSILDAVHEHGDVVRVTKRGRVVARLVADSDGDDRPWTSLRGTATWTGDPCAPAVREDEVEALR